MKLKPGLHPRNKHKKGYDFDVLTKHNNNLISYVTKNDYGNLTIDFSDPKAVKELNLTLLQVYYGINKWVFPDENLCPPIPGRVDYIHYVSELLSDSKNIDKITVLDIGTGATCIYPLLGVKEYDWNLKEEISEDYKSDLKGSYQSKNIKTVIQTYKSQGFSQNFLNRVKRRYELRLAHAKKVSKAIDMIFNKEPTKKTKKKKEEEPKPEPEEENNDEEEQDQEDDGPEEDEALDVEVDEDIEEQQEEEEYFSDGGD